MTPLSLREARCLFSQCLAELITWAIARGYQIAIDEVTNHQGTGHMKGSLHYEGLAADLNLYKDGVYLEKAEDHQSLGDQWKRIGQKYDAPLAWGGDFKSRDANHYSLSYGGKS